jgi:tRNA threonylcarbamoyladenosine biosynthesis protein TsaE
MAGMNTEMNLEITCIDSTATERLGNSIGKNLKGGEIFELISDLGGGKTSFVRAMAAAIGIHDVSSPSFTIHNVYSSDTLTMHHYDFYRLAEPGVVQNELKETLFLPDSVSCIEWAESVHRVLPDTRITVNITPTDNDGRLFVFRFPSTLAYVFSGVKNECED